MGLCASSSPKGNDRSNKYADSEETKSVSVDVQSHPVALHSDIIFDLLATGNSDETISCGVDQTIVHYNWDTKTVLHKFKEPKTIHKMVYAPRLNAVFTASREPSVRQWSLSEAKSEAPVQMFKGASLPLADVALNSDESIVCAGGRDYYVRFWDVSSGRELAACLDGNMNVVTALRWVRESTLVVQTSEDLELRIWDSRSHKVEQKFSTDKYFPLGCDVSPDGFTVATAHTGFDADGCYIKLWDRRTGKLLSTLTGHTQSVYECSFLPDAPHMLVSASKDQCVKAWDCKSETCLSTVSVPTSTEVRCVAVAAREGFPKRVYAGCGAGVLHAYTLDQEGRLTAIARTAQAFG